MLEKVLGCRLPENLWAILLMEADLNFANKLFFGYRMMIKAEEDKAIPAEIAGSRKGRQVIDVALNRCLMWDTICLKYICAIMTLVDAANCYDRMVHALISLCTEQLGLQKPIINSLLRMIQQMHFYLRTSFGDSDHSYSGPCEMPLQGCCQGNGGGLGMLVSVMIPLVENLHRHGHTAQLLYAYSGRSINTMGYVYVDNIDLLSTAFHMKEPFMNILLRAQGTTTTWQGDLQVTGGDLKWDKSDWCSMDFIWDGDGQWRYKEPDESLGDIWMKDPSGANVMMQRKGTGDTKVAVGAMQAVDGSMDGQMEFMLEKIKEFGKAFKESWVCKRWHGWGYAP